jgi:hypothetical protein
VFTLALKGKSTKSKSKRKKAIPTKNIKEIIPKNLQ